MIVTYDISETNLISLRSDADLFYQKVCPLQLLCRSPFCYGVFFVLQAIELSAEVLSNVKFIQEKKLIGKL